MVDRFFSGQLRRYDCSSCGTKQILNSLSNVVTWISVSRNYNRQELFRGWAQERGEKGFWHSLSCHKERVNNCNCLIGIPKQDIEKSQTFFSAEVIFQPTADFAARRHGLALRIVYGTSAAYRHVPKSIQETACDLQIGMNAPNFLLHLERQNQCPVVGFYSVFCRLCATVHSVSRHELRGNGIA